MIAVVVPSRGRPKNIVALLEAWIATEIGFRADLHVYVDGDDPSLAEYQQIVLPSWAQLHITPAQEKPLRLGGTLNLAMRQIGGWEANYDVVGFMGDDHRPRSKSWDREIEAIAGALPGAVVYGNDLVHGPGLPTAVFMDARIVRTLGHFVLPGQIHLWMDNYWKTLGEQLGTLRYLPDVVIEHVHPITGKAEWDEHYIANNAQAVWENDERIYKEWVATQMPADIARVKAALS